ncbi:MAG: peptidoglycan DD-metalloendopeptidase family protein [Gammaproteobacteria bacterium]
MKQASNTILLANHCGQVRSLEIDPLRTSLLFTAGVIAICATLLFSGFRYGVITEADKQLQEVAELRSLILLQQAGIVRIREAALSNLDALTLRLGRMQAQMLRLDALGARLVAQADLDAAEFDFDIAPPVGGPQDAVARSATTVADFLGMLGELDATVADRAAKLEALEQMLLNRHLRERIVPSGRAVEKGLLSSKYGKRIDPFSGKQEQHRGIDIAGKEGTSIMAVADGIVTWSGKRAGYGNLVEINHGKGYVTRYGHNKQPLVAAGDTVKKGQVIALMGSTGRSTGPHVHIEVLHNDKHVNPAKYLAN